MEQQLKQRLIGVTIVVALAVIFVPMLFDKAGDKSGRGVSDVPPIPEGVMEKSLDLPKTAADLAPKESEEKTTESGYRIIPLDEAPAEKPDAKPLSDAARPAADKAAEATEEPVVEEDEFGVGEDAAETEPKSQPAGSVKPAATKAVRPDAVEKSAVDGKKPKPAERAPKSPEDAPKRVETTIPATVAKPKAPVLPKPADATVQKPTAEPAPVRTAPLMAPKPAPSKAPAASKPVPTETAPPKAAPAPATPAVAKPAAEGASGVSAWVVQTGAFTSEAKAKALVDKLRQSKFPAFVETLPGDNGAVYRVQVGPELERGRAEQTQKQIESNTGIRGIVVPHD